jgi:hypothetical protein
MFQVEVFFAVAPCRFVVGYLGLEFSPPSIFTLKTETTLMCYHSTTWRHIPEDIDSREESTWETLLLWKNNIKMDLRKIVFEDADWIEVSRDNSSHHTFHILTRLSHHHHHHHHHQILYLIRPSFRWSFKTAVSLWMVLPNLYKSSVYCRSL